MSGATVFLADKPSLAYLSFLGAFAAVSSLGAATFAFLLFASAWHGNWEEAGLLGLCTLFALALALTWHPLLSAWRQRRHPELHAITIDSRFLTYRDDSVLTQIPLEAIEDIRILSTPDDNEVSDSWMTVVFYRESNSETSRLEIDTLAFSNVWQGGDKDFAHILREAIRKHRPL
jgi:hypothetical protein